MSFNMRLGIVLLFLCLQTSAPTDIALGFKPLRCRKNADCPRPEKCFSFLGSSARNIYTEYGVCRCPEGYTKHRCGFCKETSGCGSSCAPPNKCINNKCWCLEGLGFIKDNKSGKCIDTCPGCRYPKYCKYNNILKKRECVCPEGTNVTKSGCRSSCPEGDKYPCHRSAKCYPTNDGPHCECPAKTKGDPWKKSGAGCRNPCKPCNITHQTCVLVTTTRYKEFRVKPRCLCKPTFKRDLNGNCVSRCVKNCTGPTKCLSHNGNYFCACRPDKFNIMPVNGKCVDKCGDSCSSGKKCKEWLIGSGQFQCRCPCGQKEVGGQCQRICRNCRHSRKTCKLDPSTLPEETYRCGCKDGYREIAPQPGKPKKTQCRDINECQHKKKHDGKLLKQCNGGKCINTIGSFICTCKRGEMAYDLYNRRTSTIFRVCDKYSPWDKNWEPIPI